MHCNLKAARRHASRSGMFLVEFVLCMRTNFTSYQSDIGIRFSDPYFLKKFDDQI